MPSSYCCTTLNDRPAAMIAAMTSITMTTTMPAMGGRLQLAYLHGSATASVTRIGLFGFRSDVASHNGAHPGGERHVTMTRRPHRRAKERGGEWTDERGWLARGDGAASRPHALRRPAREALNMIARDTDWDGVRLHVVTGKGGTGKTTVAAALALALAG